MLSLKRPIMIPAHNTGQYNGTFIQKLPVPKIVSTPCSKKKHNPKQIKEVKTLTTNMLLFFKLIKGHEKMKYRRIHCTNQYPPT